MLDGGAESHTCCPLACCATSDKARNLSVASPLPICFLGGNRTVEPRGPFHLTHFLSEGANPHGDTSPGALQGATWTSELHVDEACRGHSGFLMRCGHWVPERAGLLFLLFFRPWVGQSACVNRLWDDLLQNKKLADVTGSCGSQSHLPRSSGSL